MRQLVTIKRRMIQIIPLFFLFEVRVHYLMHQILKSFEFSCSQLLVNNIFKRCNKQLVICFKNHLIDSIGFKQFHMVSKHWKYFNAQLIFTQVFHAAPVDEDEIGGARLAELKVTTAQLAKTKDKRQKKWRRSLPCEITRSEVTTLNN